MTVQYHPNTKINGYIDTAINLVVRNLTFRQIGDRVSASGDPLLPIQEHNLTFLELVLESIGDTSLYYLCTTVDISELWTRLRVHPLNEHIDVCEQIQTWALQWRLKSFTTTKEYVDWLVHISSVFGSQQFQTIVDGSSDFNVFKELYDNQDDFLQHAVVDDDMLERSPTSNDFLKILAATPWFVFFITMHLGYTELLRDLNMNSQMTSIAGLQ